MKLSDFITEALRDSIREKLEETYVKMMNFFDMVNFDEFLNGAIDEIEKEVESLLEVTNDTVALVNRRVKKTKQRWFKKEITEEGAFHEEIYIARGLNERLLLTGEMNKFQNLYDGAKDYKELEKNIFEELEKWVEDDSSLLTEFRYLKSKQGYQIERAFSNDALYIGLNMLKDEYPYGKQSAIVGIPTVMGLIPIDHTNRFKIDDSNVIERQGKQYFANKYLIDDELIMESLMSVDIKLKKGVMASTLKILGWDDVETFFILLSKRDDDFFTTREIVTDVGSIVKEKYKSRGQKNYENVKESLFRMEYLSTGIITPSLMGFTFRLLDAVEIYKLPTGQEFVRAMVSANVVNDYVADRTIKMYTDVIDGFKLNASKVLVFALQRERIRCFSEGNLIFNTNTNFFRRTLYFTNKRRDANIRMVENALDEIVEHNIALKGYERKGDMFKLKFYPITEKEKRDLLGEEGELDYLNSYLDYLNSYKELKGFNEEFPPPSDKIIVSE